MIKHLTAIGNSMGIIIDRPILELLHISKDTPLEISTDGKGLTIRPASVEHHKQVRSAAMNVMDTHEETLKKLAK